MNKRLMALFTALLMLPLTGLLPITGVANLTPDYSVTIVKPDERHSVATNADSVREVLEDEGYKLDDFRKIFPSPKSSVVDGLQIFLYPEKRVSSKSYKRINPETQKVTTRALPEGRSLTIQGARQGKRLPDKVVRESSPRVVMEGVARHQRRDLERLKDEKMLLFEATGYSPHAQSTAPFNDGFSAIGLPAGYGMVAVDPSIIPLGTRLFIEGYGYAVAADVGADIQGRRIDLCFETHENALKFGRKWVKVHILG